MSTYKEYLSTVTNQEEAAPRGTAVRSIGEMVRDAEGSSRYAAARTSVDTFLNEIDQAYNPMLITQTSERSRLGFLCTKITETIIPVVAGSVTKGAIEVAGVFSGPLAGAAAAGITGMVTGSAAAAIEMHSVKRDGQGAKELYRDKILKREQQKDEIANESNGLKRVLKGAWMGLKMYSTGLKNIALEQGLGVKRRNNAIEEIIEANGIDMEHPLYEQLSSLDVNTLKDLTKKLYTQSMISGFLEQGDMENVSKKVNLLIGSNLALMRKYKTLPNPEIIVQKIFEESQSDVSKIIGRTRFAYILTGGIDRAAKSAIYTLLLGNAVDSVRKFLNGTGSGQEAAISHAGSSFDHELAENAQDKIQIDNLYHTAQDNVARAHDALEATSESQSTLSIEDKVNEVFGANARQYLFGGGHAPGSRLDRLEVLDNLHNELTANPSLRNTAEALASQRGWTPEEFWGAVVARAQYAHGTDNGIFTKLISQIQNNDFSQIGNLEQGWYAAKSFDAKWGNMIDWALESGTPGSSADLEEAIRNYEAAIAQLTQYSDARAAVDTLRSHLLENAWREAMSGHDINLESLASIVRNNIDQISSAAGGMALLHMGAEAVITNDNVDYLNVRNRAPGRRRGAGAPGGGPAGGAGTGRGGRVGGGFGNPAVYGSGGSGVGQPNGAASAFNAPGRAARAGGGNPNQGPRINLGADYDPAADPSTERNWRRFAARTNLQNFQGVPNLYRFLDVNPNDSMVIIEQNAQDLIRRNQQMARTNPQGAASEIEKIEDAMDVLRNARKAYHSAYQARYGQQQSQTSGAGRGNNGGGRGGLTGNRGRSSSPRGQGNTGGAGNRGSIRPNRQGGNGGQAPSNGGPSYGGSPSGGAPARGGRGNAPRGGPSGGSGNGRGRGQGGGFGNPAIYGSAGQSGQSRSGGPQGGGQQGGGRQRRNTP